MRRQLAGGSTIRNQKFVVEYFCRPDNCKTGHFHVVKKMRTATKMSKNEKCICKAWKTTVFTFFTSVNSTVTLIEQLPKVQNVLYLMG